MSQGPEAILRNLVWSRFSLAVAPMVFATQAEGLVYRCPNSIWAIKAQIPIMEQVFGRLSLSLSELNLGYQGTNTYNGASVPNAKSNILSKEPFVFTNPQER
jgi:hypothetical protein